MNYKKVKGGIVLVGECDDFSCAVQNRKKEWCIHLGKFCVYKNPQSRVIKPIKGSKEDENAVKTKGKNAS